MITDDVKTKIIYSFERDKVKFDSGDFQKVLVMLEDHDSQVDDPDQEAELGKQLT